ncbi:hypothetical protein HDU84_008330 [Entophlyctis sp. JEL0112]|nr:hypothetical protein HDU84_008330 [Entophlyctis sp. JEL0112]
MTTTPKSVGYRGAILLGSIAIVTGITWTVAITTWNASTTLSQYSGFLPVAYTLGLRHGLDADHIAAIDNVTRSLVRNGDSPISVGLFFSLGHSTIVIIATFLVAVVSAAIAPQYESYNNVASIIGTVISATFLLLLAGLNAYSAYSIYLQIRMMRKNQQNPVDVADNSNQNVASPEALPETNIEENSEQVPKELDHTTVSAYALPDINIETNFERIPKEVDQPTTVADGLLETNIEANSEQAPKETDFTVEIPQGIFTRIFGAKLFRMIDKPYKMYFVGFLFGLGFDTASEIALLAISTQTAVSQSTDSPASSWGILALPFLFTCGMCLVDSIDGILVAKAYTWARGSHETALFYNLVVTIASLGFAVVVALIELLGLGPSDDSSGFWQFVQDLNGDTFMYLGVVFAASLALGWLLTALCFFGTRTRAWKDAASV